VKGMALMHEGGHREKLTRSIPGATARTPRWRPFGMSVPHGHLLGDGIITTTRVSCLLLSLLATKDYSQKKSCPVLLHEKATTGIIMTYF
jgi:hypothetical protein